MWFRDLFKKRRDSDAEQGAQEPTINQGIFYLYLIIILQIVLVLGLASIIMVVGKVMATPLWVFLFVMLLCGAGIVYIYRKAKRQFQKFRESFSHVDMSNRNYEISFMGGVVTMRIEQNPNPRPLLEAPRQPTLIDTDTIDTGHLR